MAQVRLDFSYFEYPRIETFEHVIMSLLAFAREHKAQTGFEAGGFIIYFVQRNGLKKYPQLNYGGPAGALAIIRPCVPVSAGCACKEFRICMEYVQILHGTSAESCHTNRCLSHEGMHDLPRRSHCRQSSLTAHLQRLLIACNMTCPC